MTDQITTTCTRCWNKDRVMVKLKVKQKLDGTGYASCPICKKKHNLPTDISMKLINAPMLPGM